MKEEVIEEKMQVLLNTIMLESKRWGHYKSATIPLVDLLPDIRKAGFNKLEVWGYHLWGINPEQLSFLTKKLREQGMTVPSIGSYLTGQGGEKKEDILSIARRYFFLCEKLQAKRMRVFCGNRDFENSSQEYLEFIDRVFEEIVKMGQDRGIKVMPEMHGGSVIGSIEGLKRVLEKWGKSRDFGVVWQPYEFKTEPALKALDAALGHIQSVHLQNRHDGEFVALAEGDVDYRQILRKLAASGYGGFFVLEFTAGVVSSSTGEFNYRDVLDSATRDYSWLESTWKEVLGE